MSQRREISWRDDGVGDGNEQGKHSREDVEDDRAWNRDPGVVGIEDVRNCFAISMMGQGGGQLTSRSHSHGYEGQDAL